MYIDCRFIPTNKTRLGTLLSNSVLCELDLTAVRGYNGLRRNKNSWKRGCPRAVRLYLILTTQNAIRRALNYMCMCAPSDACDRLDGGFFPVFPDVWF